MGTETNRNFEQDQQAVQAVRAGDAERYRELVERHERRVFAVAWSRLGDAALAEEAAQEAFVRAYQRLWLLGDGAKFSAWITAITRRVAVNCGLRHRRELDRRERWALEQSRTGAEETPEFCPPETLRQALAELPAAHRECLVLFYLEGRSGSEAAAALGISETALRTRLHRARAALREQLEQRLGQSLEQLRPSRPLASGVMAAILSSSSAKVAGGVGAGAKILSWLLPFKFLTWFIWAFWAIPLLPGLFLGRRMIRMDQGNYRDTEGFRARLHGEFVKKMKSWPMLLVLVGLPLLIWGMVLLAASVVGIRMFYLLLAVVLLLPMCFAARRLVISPNQFNVGTFVSSFFLMAGCLALGLELLPIRAFNVFMMLYLLPVAICYGSRPLRMDYNLFLRASQKMLGCLPVETPSADAARRLGRLDLLLFARFLGRRWLVLDYHWEDQGLRLRLPPVKPSFWNSLYMSFGKRPSTLTLAWNGSVSARLGKRDEGDLLALEGRSLPAAGDMEKQVVASVELAWGQFREGRAADAERSLGERPEADVFVVPTAQSRSTRWARGGMFALVAVMLVLNTWIFLMGWTNGLKPVNVTEAEVRATLAGWDKPAFSRDSVGPWISGLDRHFVLPPTNLLTPGALQAMRQDVSYGMSGAGKDSPESNLRALGNWVLEKAVVDGWISYADLGLTPAQVSAYLDSSPPPGVSHFMLRGSPTGGRVYDDTSIGELSLAQLRWLRDLNRLNLLDRQDIVTQLRSAQALSGRAAPGQPSIADWRAVRGLFVSPNYPVLQATYCDLAALEILGALNQIDPEACVQGILRLHRAKGYFPNPEGNSSFGISGNAQDTFCAFESLRILGALDRVKDLDKWQFRPGEVSKPGAAPRVVTWDEIEAWVCAQRLARDLAEHKQNPAAPWRSLREP